MNKIIIIIIIIAAIAGVGWFVFSKGDDSKQEPNEAAQTSKEKSLDTAPTFSLKDYDGNDVASGDFEGKILVVNSWAKWCPFCVDELPDFAELQAAFPNEVQVIAINRAESLTTAKGYTDNFDLTDKYVFLLDPKDSFYKSIGGFSMPETLFVDKDGKIRVHKRGPMEFSEMKEKINSILEQSES